MPKEKDKGSITGASLKQSNRGKKGGLTGSKRLTPEQEVDAKARDRVQEHLKDYVQNVGDTARKAGDTAKSVSNAIGSVVTGVGNVAEAIGIKPTGKASSERYELQAHDAFGGLELPTFDPQNHLATDLFKVSSPLERTKKIDADLAVEHIEEQRQTIRIASANLDLNTDILKTGEKSQKMTQAAISYGTSKVQTDTKLIQFNEALVNNEIAYTKLAQTEQKLVHEQITLDAFQNKTDQRKRYWQAKHQLGESRIRDVEMARLKIDTKLGAIDVDASVAE